MKGRVSLTELVPFGEVVMFKVPKTGDALGSFEDRWQQGVWLGCTIRDGMTIIGTHDGVHKVGTFKRKLDGEQWSAKFDPHAPPGWNPTIRHSLRVSGN